MKTLLLLLTLAFLPSLGATQFTDAKTGKTVRGDIYGVSKQDKIVVITTDDFKTYSINYSRLITDDQIYIENWSQAKERLKKADKAAEESSKRIEEQRKALEGQFNQEIGYSERLDQLNREGGHVEERKQLILRLKTVISNYSDSDGYWSITYKEGNAIISLNSNGRLSSYESN